MPTPIEQLLSRTLYTTDGTTTVWNFNFSDGYLLPAHVKAYTETPAGVRTPITVTEAMLIGEFQLQIVPALAAGNTLVIYRDTPKTAPLVNFADSAGVTEVALDTSARQAIMVAAENTDTIASSTVADAEAAAVSAAASAAAAAAALDDFDDKYLGAYVSDPEADNDGDPLVIGAIYWNTTSGALRVYGALGWDYPTFPGANLVNRTMKVFNGDGVTTSFVLDTDAVLVENILLTVHGVSQTPGANFSYTPGTKTITFLTGAPPVGTGNVVANYGNLYALAGAGSGSPTYGTWSTANFTLDSTTPNGRVEFPDTSPSGWNTVPGRKTVDFEFHSANFFAANPNAHIAVVTRCDTDVIATDVRGAGMIFGDLTWAGFAGDEAKFKPTTILESWSRPQIAGQRFLWPESTGPRNALLVDGVTYRMIVETTVQPQTPGVYMRYRLYRKVYPDTKLAWELLVDTGDVLDYSNVSDMTKKGLVFGQVFLDNLVGPWWVSINNLKVTWGPPGTPASDTTAGLSKYGAELNGDLNVYGLSRTFRFPQPGGASLVPYFKFQTSNTNSATTVVAVPNGTGSTANFLAANHSVGETSYKAVHIGMEASEALLETFGFNEVDPELGINIGAANRVATFNPDGMRLAGAGRTIGQNLTWGVHSEGQTAATAFTASPFNLEEVCTDGIIRTYMSPTPTNAQVEVVVRPLYCIVSSLIAELKAKKVI